MAEPREPSTEPARRENWRRRPHPARLSERHAHFAWIVEHHDDALDRNLPTYPDPVSGFSVFTADFLAKRAYCCDSGCRHCPYVN